MYYNVEPKLRWIYTHTCPKLCGGCRESLFRDGLTSKVPKPRQYCLYGLKDHTAKLTFVINTVQYHFSVVQKLQYYNNKHLLNLTLRLKTYLMSPNTTTYHNNMKAFSLPPHTDIYCKLKLATTKVFQNQADI